MDDTPLRGKLSDIPFPSVLQAVWKRGLTGTLLVLIKGGTKAFAIENGALAVDRSRFEERPFLESLLTSGSLDLISLSRVEDYAEKHEVSLIRALLEVPFFRPEEVWKRLETYVVNECLSLFSEQEGEYEFEEAPGGGPFLLSDISLPALILDGVRQIKDVSVLDPHLPPETELLRSHPLGSSDSFVLAPHETYILRSLARGISFSDLMETSELGRAETRRTLFALLCLGLVRTRESRPKTGKASEEWSFSDLEGLYRTFNDKCAYIFKYVTKEIGPVASSVIEKSLNEISAGLDQTFQGFVLQSDGRIELKTPLRRNLNLSGEGGRKSFLRSMDEILMAEVLAVRRTLGPDHESTLVRSLERVGDPG